VPLQRLFSTFPNGLPGLGLLLQRLTTGTALVQLAMIHLRSQAGLATMLPQVICLAAGLLLLLGLWTPIAGAVIAILQLWALVCGDPDPWIRVLLAMLGATVALIGPGAWSVDARLFGRKQISVPPHQDF
jgi:uncharacterized membrane protein YphA (DoxX/SURF4 family)